MENNWILQQESKLIYMEDETSKRHIREEQECIHDKKTRQELEIHKMKLKLQYRRKTSHKDEKTKLVKGNIPKLVITKFQANHLA